MLTPDKKFLKPNGDKAKISTRQQLLVWMFLIAPEKCSWGKEIKIANKLFQKRMDLTFWKWLSYEMDFKLNSLAFFLTKDGIKLLKLKYILFIKLGKLDLRPKKSRTLEGKKIGKDKPVKKKPKNLRDFINYAEDKKN